MRFPAVFSGGLLIICTALAGGCSRNDKADVPANAVPPPATRPGVNNSPTPAAPQPAK